MRKIPLVVIFSYEASNCPATVSVELRLPGQSLGAMGKAATRCSAYPITDSKVRAEGRRRIALYSYRVLSEGLGQFASLS